MNIYNFGLFGFTYTKQKIFTYPDFKHYKIRHKVKLLTKKRFNQLKTFLSW